MCSWLHTSNEHGEDAEDLLGQSVCGDISKANARQRRASEVESRYVTLAVRDIHRGHFQPFRQVVDPACGKREAGENLIAFF